MGVPPFRLAHPGFQRCCQAMIMRLRHLGVRANGRLESVLSKQFYGLHSWQTMLLGGCFIFDPVSSKPNQFQHSLPSGWRRCSRYRLMPCQ
ncbi:protein of unknown function [Pseudomonas sp. JV551A1]|uniref:Uncharacterized protein n=1 Tax=Pseudomonas inefficax TaxID=2078786 RepID=A0AAQ1P3Z2_9PSED|nr:protein of unknown function [Pseudomonas sp. JV551A1]SPO58570.1 protein of unknown function [Pseudomonas inefficax]